MGLGGASAPAQSPFPASSTDSPPVLDVPFLPQSVLLCGGAALAMVERWWGRRGVFAEDFAALVRPELGGILTQDLVSAARARGWDTRVLEGTPEVLRRQLDDGTPVVALIQVAPHRYHYVVLLGWRGGKVTYHDPARAPYLILDESLFLALWTGADRWAMVIRPMPAPDPPPIPDAPAGSPPQAPIDSLPCAPWLDRAVDAVVQGRLEEGFGLLEEAGRACPGEPLVLREKAGVRFKQGRHLEATRLAGAYVTVVPRDEVGWQLLASSRYLTGDLGGALAAWNALGRPTIDLIRIDGTRGIRYREIAEAASVPPGTVLTPASLALAQRRVSDVPALRRAVVEYQPVPGGIVEVRIAIVERPVLDPAWRLLAAGAVRAMAQSEIGLEMATPTGAGELWSASWRWGSARPRTAIRADAPAHLLIPGVLGIEGAWERFRFGNGPGRPVTLEESRRSGFVGFGGWLTASIRPSAGLRVERWSGRRDYVTVSAGAAFQPGDDRLVLVATSERAVAISAHRSHTRVSARGTWTSARGLHRAAWSTRLGLEWASPHAPLGSWPLAGGALSWAVPLRAHSLDADRVLVGRGILHAGVAGDQPFARMGPLVLAAGAFLDAARVAASISSATDRWYLDAGVGLRVGIAEGRLGVLRLDLAKGLAGDRSTSFSIGMHRSWPLFELPR